MAGLTWQDINLEEQYLTVRRSVRYNGAAHKHEIGSTKRKKVRIVDSTTMNVYAHATREAKRDSAKLFDKVVGMN